MIASLQMIFPSSECKFEHVCNRIINGHACLSPHLSYQHYVASKSGGGTHFQIGSCLDIPFRSPFNIPLWRSELLGDIDEKFLIEGLTEGFPLNPVDICYSNAEWTITSLAQIPVSVTKLKSQF